PACAACTICSRFASAVTNSTCRFFRLSSPRTAFSSSMPGMPGMFQSVIRKSMPPPFRIGSAVAPSSASTVFVNPSSRRRFLMMRRIVEKSSTTSTFIPLSISFLEFLVPPFAEACAQPGQRLAVYLADPRLRHTQHLPDLLQVQLVVVVQRKHQPLPFRQLVDRTGRRRREAFLEAKPRRVVALARQSLDVVGFTVGRHRLETEHPALRHLPDHVVVGVEVDAHLGRDVARTGFASRPALDGTHRLAD